MNKFPNFLTISRIFVIPLIVLCFYIETSAAKFVAFGLYVLACITDFLDGYFARQWHQVSNFGKILDPIADKLLVSIILLMLAGYGVISGVNLIAAAIILAREILVSGLREYSAYMNMPMASTRYAKWKTAFQMAAIAFLLLYFANGNSTLGKIGIVGLWFAAILTIITGYRYAIKSGLSFKI